MEDHSGVADRTGNSVDSAVARVKGKHHDGDVIRGRRNYAVNSGGTASSLVLSDARAFSIVLQQKKRKNRTIIVTEDKTKNLQKKKAEERKNYILLRRN